MQATEAKWAMNHGEMLSLVHKYVAANPTPVSKSLKLSWIDQLSPRTTPDVVVDVFGSGWLMLAKRGGYFCGFAFEPDEPSSKCRRTCGGDCVVEGRSVHLPSACPRLDFGFILPVPQLSCDANCLDNIHIPGQCTGLRLSEEDQLKLADFKGHLQRIWTDVDVRAQVIAVLFSQIWIQTTPSHASLLCGVEVPSLDKQTAQAKEMVTRWLNPTTRKQLISSTERSVPLSKRPLPVVFTWVSIWEKKTPPPVHWGLTSRVLPFQEVLDSPPRQPPGVLSDSPSIAPAAEVEVYYTWTFSSSSVWTQIDTWQPDHFNRRFDLSHSSPCCVQPFCADQLIAWATGSVYARGCRVVSTQETEALTRAKDVLPEQLPKAAQNNPLVRYAGLGPGRPDLPPILLKLESLGQRHALYNVLVGPCPEFLQSHCQEARTPSDTRLPHQKEQAELERLDIATCPSLV